MLRPAIIYLLALLLNAGCAVSLVHAQAPEGPPPKIDFASVLALDAKTAAAVDQVLREQH